MTYKVIADVDVKTPTGIKNLRPGQVIKLSASSATALIEAGKIEPLPYITDYGSLVIPWNSHPRYHYWKPGGKSLCETLKELGRCDLIPKYKSIYSN